MMLNRFGSLNYEINRPLPIAKNKKVIELMKDKLGRKIMTEFVALRPKTYSYLIDMAIVIKKETKNKTMCNKRNSQVYWLSKLLSKQWKHIKTTIKI